MRGRLLVLLAVIPALAQAQTAPAPPPKPAAPAPPVGLHRWLDLQTGIADARYRLVESSAGVRTLSQIQHRQTFKAALKLDPAARYTVQIGVGSGSSFTGSWDTTGAGTGDADWNPAVRQFFFAAAPVKGLEVQVGGLAPIRGESTEITSYDNDGFLVGERLSVKRPATLWLDEVSLTFGRLGDLNEPNVFERFDNWSDHNFAQVIVAKKFGRRVAGSLEWTTADDEDTLRQAVRVGVKETHVVDAVRLEVYERVTAADTRASATGRGFAVSAERAITKALTMNGGYATIDRFNPALNGDRLLRGQRGFVEVRYALTPEVSVSTFYTRAFHNDFPVPNRTRFDLVVSYNVLKALQRNGLW
jgi:hypothetical protein